RASGMGWGQIAQSYGTTMGAVNRSIRVPSTVTAAPASTAVAATSSNAGTATSSPRGAVSASSATVSGTTGSSGRTATGVVTANGSAPGQAHAYGRGIVTGNGGASATAATTTTRGSSAGGTPGNRGQKETGAFAPARVHQNLPRITFRSPAFREPHLPLAFRVGAGSSRLMFKNTPDGVLLSDDSIPLCNGFRCPRFHRLGGHHE